MKQPYVFISPEYTNSRPLIDLMTGYEPIFLCINAPYDDPNTIAFPRARTLEDFRRLIDNSQQIKNLIENLSSKEKVYLKSFENRKELTSIQRGKLEVIGLDHVTHKFFSDKCNQYELLKNVVPIVNHTVTDKENAKDLFEKHQTENGTFTSLPFGFGGNGAKVHSDKEQFLKYIRSVPDEKFIVADAKQIRSNYSIEALIANEHEIAIFGLSESILDGTCSTAAWSSPEISPSLKRQITEAAYHASKKIAEQGYFGYADLDFFVDKQDNLYFAELNPRYAASTAEKMCALELSRPPGHPTIPDLELMIHQQRTMGMYSVWSEPENIRWYKEEFWMTDGVVINDYSRPDISEQELFRQKGTNIYGAAKVGTRIGSEEKKIGKLVSVYDNNITKNQAYQHAQRIKSELFQKSE
ncbi:MAG: hypothetical protein ACLFNB_01095 [Candidatus Woesearchaeota archaeon]